jgi:hypothetical protein
MHQYNALRLIFIVLFVVGFAVLYGIFLLRILDAPNGMPPDFGEPAVTIAAILSGVLGSGLCRCSRD